MDFIPKLQSTDNLPMRVTNKAHYTNAGTVGFLGTREHGGIVKDFSTTGQGNNIADIGVKIGADPVMRTGALGAVGLNRVDGSSFADVMLRAIDGVSNDTNKVGALTEMAIIDPGSVDAHDITIAEAQASLSLNITRTILSRLTQAWRDVINTR